MQIIDLPRGPWGGGQCSTASGQSKIPLPPAPSDKEGQDEGDTYLEIFLNEQIFVFKHFLSKVYTLTVMEIPGFLLPALRRAPPTPKD